MTKVNDLTGQKFNRLSVLGRKGSSKDGKATWSCLCDCGNPKEVIVTSYRLTSGHTKSCGCLYKESRTVSKNKKHGYFGTRIYRIWSGMMTRCTNPNHKHYNDYGGRGIQVCDQWKTFEGFIKDVGLPPSDDHTLDRYPDPNGNYEPNNFRWATSTEQGRNRKNTIMLTYKNETKSLIEWADFFDIKYSTAKRRYYKGLCVEEILGIDKKDGGIAC